MVSDPASLAMFGNKFGSGPALDAVGEEHLKLDTDQAVASCNTTMASSSSGVSLGADSGFLDASLASTKGKGRNEDEGSDSEDFHLHLSIDEGDEDEVVGENGQRVAPGQEASNLHYGDFFPLPFLWPSTTAA